MTEAPEASTSLPYDSSPLATSLGDDRQYTPLWAQNQSWRGVFDFVDSSGPIFSMYMEMAEEEDKKMAESWKADADGILIFVRLNLLIPCLTPIHRS